MSEPLRYQLRTQLVDLLPRLRQTVPFPVDPLYVYQGAFSPQVASWFLTPPSEAMHHANIAYRNLLRATARQTIIHFNMASSIASRPEQVFWVRMENCPVCPSSKMLPFFLDEGVRCDPALQKWALAAEMLESEIRFYHDKIYAIAPLFANRTDIILAWPEVVRAVPFVVDGVRSPSSSRIRRDDTRVEEIKRRIAEILTPQASARLTDMLATAVLLPADTELAAWIGTNREDE